MIDEIVASALALSRAGQWTQALRLLDASPPTPAVRLAAASVALDSDWFAGTSLTGERLAAWLSRDGMSTFFAFVAGTGKHCAARSPARLGTIWRSRRTRFASQRRIQLGEAGRTCTEG